MVQVQAASEPPLEFPTMWFYVLRVSWNQYTGGGGTDTGTSTVQHCVQRLVVSAVAAATCRARLQLLFVFYAPLLQRMLPARRQTCHYYGLSSNVNFLCMRSNLGPHCWNNVDGATREGKIDSWRQCSK